jgi:DNA-binding NarL/FixJ family response regulator
LDYREREILRLLVHGFTVREIGFQLGVSHVMVVKIKNRINDKLEQFKDELQ